MQNEGARKLNSCAFASFDVCAELKRIVIQFEKYCGNDERVYGMSHAPTTCIVQLELFVFAHVHTALRLILPPRARQIAPVAQVVGNKTSSENFAEYICFLFGESMIQ